MGTDLEEGLLGEREQHSGKKRINKKNGHNESVVLVLNAK